MTRTSGSVFTVKDYSAYEGPLKLYTHSVVHVSAKDITFLGLHRRGRAVREALRQRGLLNLRAQTETDPNKQREAQRAASVYHAEVKEQQKLLLNHKPLIGIKDGAREIFVPSGTFVNIREVRDLVEIEIRVYQAREGVTPETWLVAQVAGVTYDIVARPHNKLKIGEVQEEGKSLFGAIDTDVLYQPRNSGGGFTNRMRVK